MSAFLVSKKHIDALVSSIDLGALREYDAVFQLKDASFDDIRNHIGQILWIENQFSVNKRYLNSSASQTARLIFLEISPH